MFIVKLINGNVETEIHGETEKLNSGSIVKGINTIDSFTFKILPSNAGFNLINDYKTIVSVYNTNKRRYEFWGRVLYSSTAMETSGLIVKDVTCESFLGFLCDSQQLYVEEQNWSVTGLLQHLIDCHNSMLEEYKHFTLGNVTVTDANDNLYCGIQRENTFDCIKKKLIDVLGGELQFRISDNTIYLDYLTEIGETKATKIALSKNIKSITKDVDPTAYITRLIPLGCKLTIEETTTDENGNENTQTVESEQRLDISSVNDGKIYIDDETAIEKYGVHIGYIEFDEVTDASNLLRKGQEWLVNNNKVQIKYSIDALDLSLLGLDIDDFQVHNFHPIENALIGVNDVARIIKKTIDVCEEIKSKIEVGDNFKTLSDLQIEQAGKIADVSNNVEKIESDYVKNNTLVQETTKLSSLISQTVDNILLTCQEVYTKQSVTEELRESIATQLSVMSDEILMNFTTTTEQIENVNGDMQTRFTEISEYIRFSGGTITLGKVGNEITLTLENDVINFKKNGVVFGSWDGENFYTGNIIIRLNERFILGNFGAFPRSDGSVMWLKVGG